MFQFYGHDLMFKELDSRYDFNELSSSSFPPTVTGAEHRMVLGNLRLVGCRGDVLYKRVQFLSNEEQTKDL